MANRRCDRAWMEVDLTTVAENYGEIINKLPRTCGVIAVVKANAYGLGAVEIAKTLEAAGCRYFATAYMDEALELREAGITSRLMVLAPIPDSMVATAIEQQLESPVVSYEQAKNFSNISLQHGTKLKVQIKLDVGLGRLGIFVKDRFPQAFHEAMDIAALEGLDVTSVFTHITGCEQNGGDEFNLYQLKLYEKMTEAMLSKGIQFDRHCLSTTPAVKYPQYCYEYIRVAALLYGSHPGAFGRFNINPTVEMHSRAIQVKTVPAGTPISYGPLFHTLRETVVATVPVGFSDGLRRTLMNGGTMLIRGKRAQIIGKLCSDHTMLDITDIPGVKEGDIVTIFGNNGASTQYVSDYAVLYPGSVSETTSCITKRVPRFYHR